MKRIKTLKELSLAVANRKAVTVPSSNCFFGPIPAAFVFNLNGRVLFRLFQYGMFIYERKK